VRGTHLTDDRVSYMLGYIGECDFECDFDIF